MTSKDIVDELAELRRGRGLQAEDLPERVGPCLRAACGVTDTGAPTAVRRRVTLKLAEVCANLPPDLELAATFALAIHEDAQGPFLGDRIASLCARLNCESRTARRRIDKAFRLLSEYLSDHSEDDQDYNEYAPDGWYVASLRSFVRMDQDPPLLTEERTIVATRDGLDEVVAAFASPRDGAPSDAREQISAQIIYGGEIIEEAHPSSSYARFVVRLPQPLAMGQRHEYGIQFRTYPRAWARPYYTLSSLRRCDHFVVRMHFPSDYRPENVWRVDGVPTRALDDFKSHGDMVEVDRLGDISAEFFNLKPGLSYGFRWSRNS